MDVQIAFLVGDDQLGNLYLNMHQNFELSTAEKPYPILDLCDLTKN